MFKNSKGRASVRAHARNYIPTDRQHRERKGKRERGREGGREKGRDGERKRERGTFKEDERKREIGYKEQSKSEPQ